MEVIRQIYEKMPATITIPEQLQDRRVEIILLSLDEIPAEDAAASSSQPDLEVLRFAGALPDFPARAPQGEFEWREDLS